MFAIFNDEFSWFYTSIFWCMNVKRDQTAIKKKAQQKLRPRNSSGTLSHIIRNWFMEDIFSISWNMLRYQETFILGRIYTTALSFIVTQHEISWYSILCKNWYSKLTKIRHMISSLINVYENLLFGLERDETKYMTLSCSLQHMLHWCWFYYRAVANCFLTLYRHTNTGSTTRYKFQSY